MSRVLSCQHYRPLLLFVLVGVMGGIVLFTLPDYGITWDEPENFAMGDRALFFYATLNPVFLDRTNDDYTRHSRFFTSHPPWGEGVESRVHLSFPPLAMALSTVLEYWLSFRWGVIHYVDARHLVNLAFFLPFIALFISVLSRILGPMAATAASLCLFLNPRFFEALHNNTKDVPAISLYGIALLVLYEAFRHGFPRRLVLLFAAAVGLGLGVKINSVFALLSGGMWLVWLHRREFSGKVRALLRPAVSVPGSPWQARGGALRLVMACGTLIAGIFFVANPWIIFGDGPLGPKAIAVLARAESIVGESSIVQACLKGLMRLYYFLDYYWQVGRLERSLTAAEAVVHMLRPAVLLVTTTPLPILLLAVIGGWDLLRGTGREAPPGLTSLLLVSAAVPLARVSLPRANYYDGIRHFMEILPLLAVFAGVGVRVVGDRLASYCPPGRRRLAGVGVCAAVGLLLSAEIWSWHPHQSAYFSQVIGGLRGAQAIQRRTGLNLWATDYWGSGYRRAVQWMNARLPPGAQVLIAVGRPGEHFVHSLPRPDLRPRFLRKDGPAGESAVVFVAYVTRPELYPVWLRGIRTAPNPAFLEGTPSGNVGLVDNPDFPVQHEFRVRGAPILKIVRAVCTRRECRPPLPGAHAGDRS